MRRLLGLLWVLWTGAGCRPPPRAGGLSRLISSDHDLLERLAGLLAVRRLRLQGGQQPRQPLRHVDLLAANADAARGVANAAAHRGALHDGLECIVTEDDADRLDVVGLAEPPRPLDGDPIAQDLGQL